jgi:hypothetical protein
LRHCCSIFTPTAPAAGKSQAQWQIGKQRCCGKLVQPSCLLHVQVRFAMLHCPIPTCDLCCNPAKQVFDPVLHWAEGELGARLVADDSLIGMDQSEELINNARSYLHGPLTHARVGAGCWLSYHAAECLKQGSGSTHAGWKLLWLFVGAQGWTSGSWQLWTQRHRRVDL